MYSSELQDLVMASSTFLRDGGGRCSACYMQSMVNAPQSWLIEEFYDVLHGALWTVNVWIDLEENEAAKFAKVVTAAEQTH